MNKRFPGIRMSAGAPSGKPGRKAAAGDEFSFSATGHAVDIVMAEADGGVPRFSGIAYTGGLVEICCWWNPVVVDLAGVRPPTKARPVLFEHDTEKPVGHFDPGDYANDGRQISIAGALSVENDWQRQIVSSSKNRFPWQMSIGARALRVEEIMPDAEVEVNGQTFQGPCTVVRESVLKEVSYVALGADDDTSASIAASRRRGVALSNGGVFVMKTFDEWARDKGLDPEALTEEERAELEREYEAWKAEQDQDDGGGSAEAGAKKPDVQARAPAAGGKADIAARNMELSIMASDVKYGALPASVRLSLLGEAKKSGWTTDHLAARLDNEVVKANRPAHPGAPNRGSSLDMSALAAGMMLQFGMDDSAVGKSVPASALDVAKKEFGRCGIKDMARACLEYEGTQWLRSYNNRKDTGWIRAAFNTASFPELLKDSMNKFLLDAYENQPHVSRQLARKLSANDYKIHTGVMFTAGGTWERVAVGGHIKYGEIGREETFTYQIEDWGEIVAITNVMLVNDDMGAIQDSLRNNIARKCALTEERSFFDMLQKNANGFFGIGNNNLMTAPLSPDGLSEAILKFRMQKNVYGDPIDIVPRILLVPPSLEQTAVELCYAREIRPGSTNTKKEVPIDNKFLRYQIEVVTTAQLTHDRYATGGVSTDDLAKRWYLLANADVAAAWGRAYLDGAESPTIEDGTGTFDTLTGLEYRGYMPFGHCQIDPRCAVMSDGTGT